MIECPFCQEVFMGTGLVKELEKHLDVCPKAPDRVPPVVPTKEPTTEATTNAVRQRR